jgi:hypothetical protein
MNSLRQSQIRYLHPIKKHPGSTGGIKTLLIYIIVALATAAMMSCGRNEPLADYEPQSPEELALKTIFLEFQDGINRKDAETVANIIHENARIMVGRERKILAKTEYGKILPKRLAENPPISFGKPKMRVSGETAEVKIYMTRGNYNGLIVYNMRKDNSKWYIQSWRY